MATNYSESRHEVKHALEDSDLPDHIVDAIIGALPKQVDIISFDDLPSRHDLLDIRGNDLVFFNTGGEVDLSHVSKSILRSVDAFVFSTNDDVTFELGGRGGKLFDGVIVTNGGDDAITVESKKDVSIFSGDGNDSVKSGKGDDKIDLGAGDDYAKTGNGDDTVCTGAGDDSVCTGAGDDEVYLQSGDDTVSTGKGEDYVKMDVGFSGYAMLDGGEEKGGKGCHDKASDVLDLRDVVIADVQKDGNELTITLDDDSVITVSNFEKFVYEHIYDDDINGQEGEIVIVGVHTFIDEFSSDC
jgi:Ca2+-binding RTX toxin-like protein